MTKSKEPTPEKKTKSTPLPDKLPGDCVDRTEEALGTVFGIVGINAPATKSKPSKDKE
ncbi:hypothetical protein V4R08_05150 [Nitrobacter sp. NHB1]|uniref:hypothetical protein n=1 Tax=Nitrobacter sp. NHB1 TaxID=3119830 RepID=UPI002FFD96FA